MSTSTSRSSGIGFIGLLTIAFIVLKLCGVIDWNWFAVLLPIWIAVVVWGMAVIVVLWVAMGKEMKRKDKP